MSSKIFTSDDIMNIQYGIGTGFGSIERAYYMGVNTYFGPRRTNRAHATSKYGPGNIGFKLNIIDRHVVLQKNSSYREKTGTSGSRSNFFF